MFKIFIYYLSYTFSFSMHFIWRLIWNSLLRRKLHVYLNGLINGMKKVSFANFQCMHRNINIFCSVVRLWTEKVTFRRLERWNKTMSRPIDSWNLKHLIKWNWKQKRIWVHAATASVCLWLILFLKYKENFFLGDAFDCAKFRPFQI